MFRQDIGLKILSLFIAVSLWLYVTLGVANSDTRVFNLVYTNLDSEKYTIAKSFSTIKVNVTGPLDALGGLHSLADNQFNAEVNLADAEPGTHTYRISNLQFGENVNRAGLTFEWPKPVSVTIQPKLFQPMKVATKITNAPPGQDIDAQATQIVPDHVTLRGSKDDLKEVKSAVAEVDLQNYPGTKEFTADVKLLDGNGSVVTTVDSSPSKVTVTPMLGPAEDQVNLPIVIQYGPSLRHGYTLRDIRVDPQDVLVKGKTTALRRVRVVKTAPIDFSNITSERTVTVKLVPIPGLIIAKKSASVRISVSRPPVAPAPKPPVIVTPTLTSPSVTPSTTPNTITH